MAERVAWGLCGWCLDVIMEISAYTLPLLTPSAHHPGRGEGRAGGEFFGREGKVLPGDTLRRSNCSNAWYHAIWVIRFFREFKQKMISSDTWRSNACNNWEHDCGCRSHATGDCSEGVVQYQKLWLTIHDWLWPDYDNDYYYDCDFDYNYDVTMNSTITYYNHSCNWWS